MIHGRLVRILYTLTPIQLYLIVGTPYNLILAYLKLEWNCFSTSIYKAS